MSPTEGSDKEEEKVTKVGEQRGLESSKSLKQEKDSGSDSLSDSSSGSDQSDVDEGKGEEDEEEDEQVDKENEDEEEDQDNGVEESEDEDEKSLVSGSRSEGSRSSIEGEEERIRSLSRSRSRSSSSTHSSRSGSQFSDSEHEKSRGRRGKDKFWEQDPEFYGIRRSNRPRIEAKPQRLQFGTGLKRKGGKRFPQGKSKRRKVSTESEEDSDEECSRNVRKRNAKVSYKEAESEDEGDLMTDDEGHDIHEESNEPEENVEGIDRVMESRMGKKGATGPYTTAYAVAERGDPNELLPAETEREKQFLIKWIGKAHLHNTWESLETLQAINVKGLKRLDNFCKREDEHARWKSRAYPEDIEYVECQLELQQELVKSYVYAERVIAERINDEGEKEYYVKWESLPYSDATWEAADLLKRRNPEAISDYKRRESSNNTPSSASAKFLRARPKFTPIKSQPDYLKGENGDLVLRDYQLDGLNWLIHSWCKENSVILADEMGLGKTIQSIGFLAHLFEQYSLCGPFLLVVPLSTMTAWQKEFSQWAPQLNVVIYLGDIASRGIIQEYEWFFKGTRKFKFNCILTTYEIVLKDKDWLSGISWSTLVVDEAHRLKNQDSLLYKSLVDFESNHRLLITGTPLQNSLKELWSLLHFIMPHQFDDWEYFEREHGSALKGYTKLHKQLEPFILRRVKKDVEKSLPAKVEQILRVDMTTVQKQYYKWILTKNYTALKKGVKGSVSTFVNVVMELKKCCNHATLIKPVDQGQADSLSQLIKGSGKLMLLDKLLVRLKDTGHRVLIFSQMVMMLDIIAEYLQLRRFPFQRLDGSIKGDMRKQALEHFNAEGSQDFCFLLSTRAGGLGINLATADTVIIFDSDWNPQNDLQAQARAHRIGQKNQVMIYRLVTKNSVEEDIVERAKKKMVLDHLVIQRMDTTGRTVLDKGMGSKSGTPFNKDELNAILKFGAEELFKEETTEGDDNCDIDEILRRAETHEEAARPGDELLSAFKVATFAVNEEEEFENASQQAEREWEQIIPEDLRKKVEQEEKEKELADLFLGPRSSRNTAAIDSKGQPLGNEALNRLAKHKKRKRGGEKESEESDYEDEAGPRKRGRPKHKDGVKGFTDVQVRKFIKSLKKFPAPLQRIAKLADDSGLVEKDHADLRKLAEQLLKGCEEAMAEPKANPQPLVKEEPTPVDGENSNSTIGPDGKPKKPTKPREKGPIFKVCGVPVNARTLSIAIEELQSLGELMPLDDTARKNWKLTIHTKNSGFDCEWGPEEDTKLLLGIWEHGLGAWEKIRESDPVLKDKIFLEGDKKPIIKHISTRADYLLRALKKHLAIMKLKQPKPRKKKEPKIKKEGQNPAVAGENGEAKKRRSKKSKKDKGPMHFVAEAEPVPVALLSDMDPKIFSECKEKMRPVKKALMFLDNPPDDSELSNAKKLEQTKDCLLQIGKRIEECLNSYPDQEHKQWKTYLWVFVSNFTDSDAQSLHKSYKRLLKSVEGSTDKHRKDKRKEKKKKKDKDRDRERDRPKKSKDKDRDKDRDRERKKEKDKSYKRDKEKGRPTNFHYENANSSHSDRDHYYHAPYRYAPPAPAHHAHGNPHYPPLPPPHKNRLAPHHDYSTQRDGYSSMRESYSGPQRDVMRRDQPPPSWAYSER